MFEYYINLKRICGLKLGNKYFLNVGISLLFKNKKTKYKQIELSSRNILSSIIW